MAMAADGAVRKALMGSVIVNFTALCQSSPYFMFSPPKER
jgi:hypothetical protein